PPTGYTLSNEVQTINIGDKNASKMQEVTFVDGQILGSLQVTKTSEAGTPLQGAVFTVSGAGFSKDITTGKDGIATLANIPWGTYTVKETKAPVGYNLNPDSQTVKITAENAGKVQKLTFVDSTIKVINVHTNGEKPSHHNTEKVSKHHNDSPDTGDSSQLPIYMILISSFVILLSINRKKLKIKK
ncbi:MAG: prealbumin-like fold domain-containing protein, partial [Clostridium sp.]|uniref:prealbumin-like fold domain-containing protein n=1 Tax=Clostridium sp. TaxID=1506 RepID=UPI003F2BD22A